jgi:hypothetical protein
MVNGKYYVNEVLEKKNVCYFETSLKQNNSLPQNIPLYVVKTGLNQIRTKQKCITSVTNRKWVGNHAYGLCKLPGYAACTRQFPASINM